MSDGGDCKHIAVSPLGDGSDYWKCEYCPRLFRPTGPDFRPEPDFRSMTLGDLEALAERYGKAVATIKEAQALFGAGLGATAGPQAIAVRGPTGNLPPRVSGGPEPAPGSPFPCPACGRQAPQQPNEATLLEECLTCGNGKPLNGAAGGIRTNKGVVAITADERARRQALMAQPAFDANGDPA